MEDDEMGGRGPVRRTCATLLTAMTLSLTVVAHSAAQGVEDPRGRKARRERGREDQQTLLRDAKAIAKRGDIVGLPTPLTQRIVEMAARPHSVLPLPPFDQLASPV